MSAEAARIICAISGRKTTSRVMAIGTVLSVSPLAIKVDDIGYTISSALCNPDIKELKSGNRVLLAAINKSCYVAICKVG